MTPFHAKHARRLIARDDALILEIGANEGDDTAQFIRAFPTGTFHCFECDPRAIAKWRKNIQHQRAHLHEVALSNSIGTHDFHQSDGRPDGPQWTNYGPHWDKSGSLLPNYRHTEFAAWMNFLPPITVPTTTLDDWIAEHLPDDAIVDFAWVDVQGAEALVLEGAQKTINRIRYWYAECDPRPLYHGMATLADLDRLLPNFRRIGEYSGFNHLWKNESL